MQCRSVHAAKKPKKTLNNKVSNKAPQIAVNLDLYTILITTSLYCKHCPLKYTCSVGIIVKLLFFQKIKNKLRTIEDQIVQKLLSFS